MNALYLVAAVARDGCIGKDGKLPWHLPEDLRHFRTHTLGHAVIMGRATYLSIGKPLAKRRNIVVTTTLSSPPDGVELAPSVEAAITLARSTDPEPRIIGGERIYQATMPLATHLLITHVDTVVDGCTARFPEIDLDRFTVFDRRKGETPGIEFVEYRALDLRSREQPLQHG